MDASSAAWLTTVLRPAGTLDPAAVRRLGAALGCLAATCDMVLLDLSAADVSNPRALARALREPAAEFERAGGCLLVTGASPRLTTELDRSAVAVAALPDGARPDGARTVPLARAAV